ncbi:MAG: FtsX-like permease family protein, partial [Bacteroidota bacterium]
SHMPVEVFLSFESPRARSWWAYVYILLKPGTSIEEVEKGMPGFFDKHYTDRGAGTVEFRFMPLRDIHLTSNLVREIMPNGDILYVRIFAWASVFLLLIALINSLNMSSALAMGRAKEIGMHLVMGASIHQLRRFALIESGLYHILAVVLGLGVLWGSLPFLQQILPFTILIPPVWLIMGMLLLAMVLGILTGIYPARVLTQASLQQVFLGRRKGNQTAHQSAMRLRHVLIGLQFTAAVLLMSSAWVSTRQVRFLQEKNLGLNPHQVLALPALPNPVTDRYTAFRDRVNSIPGVVKVSGCMQLPSTEIRDAGPVTVVGRESDPDMAPILDIQVISPDYFETLDIQLIAGEDRSADYQFTDPPRFTAEYTPEAYLGEIPRKYLINETAMHKLGFESPEEAIGQQISWEIGGYKLAAGPVTGIVADVHQETLKNRVDPTVMVVEQIWLRTILLKLSTQEMTETLGEVQAAWDELFPSYPMRYQFLDEAYARLYQQEQQQLRLLLILTGLSVILALIGLFSLVAFALRMRMQEFAIRRILGAQGRHLIRHIGQQYVVALLVASVIAIPASYYLVDQWLETFAYHIPVSSLPYVFTLIALTGLVLTAIGVQVWRSTRRNPSEVLREG